MNEAQAGVVQRRALQRAQADPTWQKQHQLAQESAKSVGALLSRVPDGALRNSILGAMNVALSEAAKDARIYTLNVSRVVMEQSNADTQGELRKELEALAVRHQDEVRKAWEQGKRDGEYQAAPIDVKELLSVMKIMAQNQAPPAQPEIKIDLPQPAPISVHIDKGAITNVMPGGEEEEIPWRVEAENGIDVTFDEEAGLIKVRHE